MRIYLIEGNRGRIQIATRLYIHEGGHKDVLDLSLDDYNKIKHRLVNGMYVDIFGSKRYFRNEGIRDEVRFSSGISKIT